MSAEHLRAELAAWCRDYEASTSKKPKIEQVLADPRAARLYHKSRELEKAAAAPPAEGGCTFYIHRRRRYCTKRRADLVTLFCCDHQDGTPVAVSSTTIARSSSSAVRAPRVAAAAPPSGAAAAGASPSYANPKRNLKRRMKRMTNPMAKQHSVAPPAPDFASIYRDLSLPLLLDVGCAKGRFLQRLAAGEGSLPPHNLLGIEIFAPLVEEANAWRDVHQPGNLHYIAGSASTILQSFGRELPNLRRVCIQFPDPWGAKHARRRLVTPSFADLLAELVPIDGEVYVSSDHVEIAEEIRTNLLGTGAFMAQPGDSGGEWLKGAPPYGVPTERDEVCSCKTVGWTADKEGGRGWREVWRCVLKKC